MSKESKVISTKYGKLQGATKNGVSVYFRIPYAGRTARFQPPVSLKKWEGVRNCTARGPIFPQVTQRLANIKGVKESVHNEQAFHLNVWSPITIYRKRNLY